MKKSMTFFLLMLAMMQVNNVKAQGDKLIKLGEMLDLFDPYNNKGKEYIPTELKPEMTFESAKNDMIKYLGKYTFVQWQYDDFAYYNDSTRVKGNRIKKEPIIVTEDYFEFTTTKEGVIRINLEDIMFDNIIHYTPQGSEGHQCTLKVGPHNFAICNPGLADALFYLQHMFRVKYSDEELETFKPKAQEYRQLKQKPALTSEQRKFIVQGNTMLEMKNPRKAIELYNKALAIDPLAYPEGYYNSALIAGMIKNYPYAIMCMKKYLLLVPEAEDAQEAQDKIYSWEILQKE